MNMDLLSAEKASAVSAFVTAEMLDSFKDRLEWDAGLKTDPEEKKRLFYDRVIKALMEGLAWSATTPKTEDIALELFRQGVPAGDVRACHKHVDVCLPNSGYRLYRMDAAGSFRIMWPASGGPVRMVLGPKEMTEFLFAFDGLVPMLEKQLAEVLKQMEALRCRRMAELKADQIARTSVEIQLDGTLPGLDVDCEYELRDGVVHLELTKTLKGALDVPMADLPALLANPERILSALSALPAGKASCHPNRPSKRHSIPRGFPFPKR